VEQSSSVAIVRIRKVPRYIVGSDELGHYGLNTVKAGRRGPWEEPYPGEL
jgi:hypothetical protein